MLTRPTLLQRKQDADEKPTLLHRCRNLVERHAVQGANDAASFDIIDAVIGIAIFAAVIGLIGSQITQAGANLTAFPGASTLLYLVPLILVAVLILKLWKGRGHTGGGGGYRGRGRRY